jgi:hypothetical protein
MSSDSYDSSSQAGPSTYASSGRSPSSPTAVGLAMLSDTSLSDDDRVLGGGGNACTGPSSTLPPARPPRRMPIPPPRSPSPELSYLRRSTSPESAAILPGAADGSIAGQSSERKAKGVMRHGGEGLSAGIPASEVESPGRSPRAEGSLGGNKGMKRRPKALDLRSGADEVRIDPELQGHLDDIASAITVTSDCESTPSS